ncbi:MAG: acVLRF1 family peptidyl-tRNA hydrolase, partial [Propionibacteriaceae bacterium]
MSSQLTRTVTIPAERLQPWLANFSARHGSIETSARYDRVTVEAADGAVARIRIPFPPLPASHDLVPTLITHVNQPRTLGAVLVRKGGFAVGVFRGAELVASKVGSAYVQGKTKAGGWSQQRYARRRANQSKNAYAEAADETARILLPHLGGLEGVLTGGDKPALAAVFDDPRLVELKTLVLPTVYAVPDPRLRVLQAFPELFRTVDIILNE